MLYCYILNFLDVFWNYYWVVQKVLSNLKKNLDIPLETIYGFYTPKESLLKDEKNLPHDDWSSFKHTIFFELKEEVC